MAKHRQTFGSVLEEALAARGRSQSWLAKELGVSAALISHWVTGTHEPPWRRVFQMEALLEVPPGTLSRVLGYLPPEAAAPTVSVEEAISQDPDLTADGRRLVLTLYQTVRGFALSLRDEQAHRPGGQTPRPRRGRPRTEAPVQ
jgi:transcriptional regulator with XRE-family HTH domain